MANEDETTRELKPVLAAIEERLAILEQRTTPLNETLAQLVTEIRELRADVGLLQVDVNQVKVDIAKMQKDLSRLREFTYEAMGDNERRLRRLEEGQAVMEIYRKRDPVMIHTQGWSLEGVVS